jgi:hypothetical protein
MVHAHRSLNQALVKEPDGPWRSSPPKVFPDLVSLIETPLSEKKYTLFEELIHGLFISKCQNRRHMRTLQRLAKPTIVTNGHENAQEVSFSQLAPDTLWLQNWLLALIISGGEPST